MRRQQIGRDRQRDERATLDRQHPIAHDGECRDCSDYRAKSDEARDTEHRQHRSVGARIHRLPQSRQAPTVDGDDD